MSELVGEIAAASNEQAQGIEQVNKAVSEMDKVVQQNAANAEESASASEEMNAQAQHLNVFVDDLAEGLLVEILTGPGEKQESGVGATGSKSARPSPAACLQKSHPGRIKEAGA